MNYSIIIPTYNSEKYLLQCIESINTLLDKDCEIIFIDDCSTDNTISIILKFQNCSYGNVYLLTNKENRGPSFSRNRGIQKAKGNYIIFIDSDDMVSNNFIKNVRSHMEDFDLLILKDTTKLSNLNVAGNTNIYKKETFINAYQFPSLPINVQMDAPWSKVFKRSIIQDNNLLFNENIRIGEDTLFVFEYILLCNKLIIIDNSVSYYFRRDEYIAEGKPYEKIDVELYHFFDAYCSLLEKHNLGEGFYKQLFYKIVDGYIYQIFERKFFNKKMSYTYKKQREGIKTLLTNPHIKKAFEIIETKTINNKKKKVLTFLIKHKIFSLSTLILRKRYYH